MKTLKVLSALLTYPTDELVLAAPELVAAIEAESVLPKKGARRPPVADHGSR